MIMMMQYYYVQRAEKEGGKLLIEFPSHVN